MGKLIGNIIATIITTILANKEARQGLLEFVSELVQRSTRNTYENGQTMDDDDRRRLESLIPERLRDTDHLRSQR